MEGFITFCGVCVCIIIFSAKFKVWLKEQEDKKLLASNPEAYKVQKEIEAAEAARNREAGLKTAGVVGGIIKGLLKK